MNIGKISQGADVELSDPEMGVVEFRHAPAAGTNNIVIKYRWYSGTTVSFIADFPPGVPAGSLSSYAESFICGSGQTEFKLTEKPRNIVSVTLDGVAVNPSQYSFNEEERRLNLFFSTTLGQELVVEYQWHRDRCEIYEVGIFDDEDPEESLMFSISGIGPIVKDINTACVSPGRSPSKRR